MAKRQDFSNPNSNLQERSCCQSPENPHTVVRLSHLETSNKINQSPWTHKVRFYLELKKKGFPPQNKLSFKCKHDVRPYSNKIKKTSN